MSNDLVYQIALGLVPNIGDVQSKILVNKFGNAQAVFKATKKHLENTDGIGKLRAKCIKEFTNFTTAENEVKFIEKHKITPLFYTDENYPKRLLNCYDAPILLFYKGSANLNASKIISVVGTRKNSDYGKQICQKLIEELKEFNPIILSGLAHGIDTIAHKEALQNELCTVGALAHGLDRLYPDQNKNLAKQMILNGGLITHFISNTEPDKQNFPKRNRLVAGMCDALIVIESAEKGGSLISAELANGYNKDVFALPGRTIDKLSQGCNYLIKQNKAALITSGKDLADLMNWQTHAKPKKKQRELFIEFTPDEKVIVDVLQLQEQTHIDDLYLKSGLSSSAVAQALLMLELQNIIASMPGKVYKLI
jgi:DNA processing protein